MDWFSLCLRFLSCFNESPLWQLKPNFRTWQFFVLGEVQILIGARTVEMSSTLALLITCHFFLLHIFKPAFVKLYLCFLSGWELKYSYNSVFNSDVGLRAQQRPLSRYHAPSHKMQALLALVWIKIGQCLNCLAEMWVSFVTTQTSCIAGFSLTFCLSLGVRRVSVWSVNTFRH